MPKKFACNKQQHDRQLDAGGISSTIVDSAFSFHIPGSKYNLYGLKISEHQTIRVDEGRTADTISTLQIKFK